MKSRVKKAYEITDAKISFVSLVDKAANKRHFLITKAEDGQANWTTFGRIVKTDSKNHYVTGIVYEPLVEDAHGDFMSEEEITKAAYWYAKNGNDVDVQHSFKSQEGVTVVENWIAKADFKIDNEEIKKGTWLITAEVTNDEVWNKIEKGEITGFSMGGQGKYSKDDVDIDDLAKSGNAEEKQSLLTRLAKALGFKAVVKGEMAEIFNERTKRSMFWTAMNTLQDCLYNCNWNHDRPDFEDDERKIREVLTDFNNIITDILTTEKYVMKSISPDFEHIGKAGKKMSGKNKETLCGIYDSLGAFLKEFDAPEELDPDSDNKSADDKKEEKNVTKAEAEKLIQESVAKALENMTGKATEQTAKVEKAETVTPEFISETVQAAISKALEPKQDSVTAEQIQQMIVAAVEKAVEPIRKQTALPSNLNSSGAVKKQEEAHYLHGIL